MTHATIERQTEWREPSRGRKASWLAVLLIVALAITLAGVFPFRQIIAQERQVDATQDKLDALAAENARLEDEIGLLGTAAEVERLAREDLGLVYPGETSYTVRTPEAGPESVPEVAAEQDGRSIVEKIWDFLTGRDLVPDG